MNILGKTGVGRDIYKHGRENASKNTDTLILVWKWSDQYDLTIYIHIHVHIQYSYVSISRRICVTACVYVLYIYTCKYALAFSIERA
jgi:hypothetical protein